MRKKPKSWADWFYYQRTPIAQCRKEYRACDPLNRSLLAQIYILEGKIESEDQLK